MGSCSEKDKENETIESRILSKLEAMEKRIDAIESSLKRIDKLSILTTEDQLFFGFVFSLVLFIIQIPDIDVCTLFESFGVKIEAARGIITTKVLLIALLILVSGVRYLVTFAKEDVKRNKLRVFSVSLLISAFYLLMAELFIRGLGTYLLRYVYVFLVIFAPVTLTLFAVLFGIIEKKWYSHYGYYGEPYISLVFGFLGLTILLTYELGMVVALFIPISDVVVLILLIASFFISLLIYKFISPLIYKFTYEVYKRLKHARNKKWQLA